MSVRHLKGATASHIHCGKKGIEGQLAGQPLSHLLDLMEAGFTYVNVHMAKYPLGTIREKIRTCPREDHREKRWEKRLHEWSDEWSEQW